MSLFRVILQPEHIRMDVFLRFPVCKLEICKQFALRIGDRHAIGSVQCRIIRRTVRGEFQHRTDTLRIRTQDLQRAAVCLAAFANVRDTQTFSLFVVLHLKDIGVRMLILADISVVSARHEIGEIAIVAPPAGMLRVADFPVLRGNHLVLVVMTERRDIIGHESVRTVRADMLRISVCNARRFHRVQSIGMSGRRRFIPDLRIFAYRAGIDSVSVLRAGRGDYFRFIAVTERCDISIVEAVPALQTGVRGVPFLRTRRKRRRFLIGMPGRGGVAVRVLIPADRTEMRGIPLVRTCRFDDDFRIGMLCTLRVVIPVTLPAQQTNIFRISLRRTGRGMNNPLAVFMLTGLLRRYGFPAHKSRKKEYRREYRRYREQYPKFGFQFCQIISSSLFHAAALAVAIACS